MVYLLLQSMWKLFATIIINMYYMEHTDTWCINLSETREKASTNYRTLHIITYIVLYCIADAFITFT